MTPHHTTPSCTHRAAEARLSALCADAAAAVAGHHPLAHSSPLPQTINTGGVSSRPSSSSSKNNAAEGSGGVSTAYGHSATYSPTSSPEASNNNCGSSLENSSYRNHTQSHTVCSGSGGVGGGEAGALINRGTSMAQHGGTGKSVSGKGVRQMLHGPWHAVHDVARLRAQLALSLREQHGMRDKLLAVHQVRALKYVGARVCCAVLCA